MQQTTLYETVEAETWGTNVRFIVRAPTEHLAIDPRVWIKWTFRFDGDIVHYYAGTDDDG